MMSSTLVALALLAQAAPLKSLPYTPSLDLAAMDRAADPCADFYQYSCGGWMKSNPIPADQAGWSVYAKAADENQQFLWGILDDAAKAKDRTPAQQKIGDFFGACMDEAAVEKAGAAPLAAGLKKIDALESKDALSTLLPALQLATSGRGMMFGFGSDQDFADATQVITFLDAGGLGLPDRDYYFKNDEKSKDIRAKYLKHVETMLGLVGERDAAAGARAVMRLETALAKVSLTRVERRDPYKLFHKLDRKQLAALTRRLSWDRFLAAAGLPDVKVVNVQEPAFFKGLDALVAEERLPAWKTYLRWHLVDAYAPYLSSAFVNADFDFFSRVLRGVTQLQPRWKRCVRYVDRQLGFALGEEFVRRTFTAKTKEDTLKMTRLIEDAMQEEIERLDWMTPATKEAAQKKLHAVNNKIGYPDKWRDYSKLEIVRGDALGNQERAREFEFARDLAKI
ncbi:MAG TPA: M13 family metallopeptidase N-terminal domain-containing protein, partial [Myxococcales bacterium]|nr:M13 family metallopeptidase N-terminal domain-containing protein [Myxococcales bacterium]